VNGPRRKELWLYMMKINDMGTIEEFWQNQVLGKFCSGFDYAV